MTTTTTGRPLAFPSSARTQRVPPMSRRGDTVTALLSTWLVGGVLGDGWAHQHRKLESFVTPWHAVLYAGFLAAAAWVVWNGWRHHRRGAPWPAAFPAGYGLAAVGAAIFWLSGLADLAWHQAFGIEQADAALLSPSHLGLLAGGLLLLTGPVRSARARRPSERERVPLEAVWALSLSAFMATFLLHPLCPFWQNPISIGHRAAIAAATAQGSTLPGSTDLAATVGAIIVTSLILFGPLVVLASRWRLSAGRVTVMLGLAPVALQAIRGFDDSGIALVGVIGAVIAGLIVHVVGVGPDRIWQTRLGLGGAAVAFWAVFMSLVAAGDGGLGITAEIWGGLLVWAGFSVLALSFLATQTVRPGPPQRP